MQKSYFLIMVNSIEYFLPVEIEAEVLKEARKWRLEDKISRIWAKDASLWTDEDESQWLGWLEIADREIKDLEKYAEFAKIAASFKSIVLLGMGGSSLSSEVLARTFRRENFFVLDSTVPAQIKSLEEKIDLKRTLFIVASKSGTTLEPNCLKQYFYERVCQEVGSEQAGKQFVAITDPDSKLHRLAESERFMWIFLGEPQVGGRFSALSVFGLVPASAMQIPVAEFLERSLEMSQACRQMNPEENPGAILGLILGVCWRFGRDKLTIFCSQEISSFGAWLEQLIAESTGKNGKAIIPIDKETILQDFSDYDDDRVFVHLKFKGSNAINSESFSAFNHPFLRIEIADEMNLGQEFFRWEFATAVAGSIMMLNPFNQPDVEAAKVEARRVMEEYERSGAIVEDEPFFEADGLKLFASADYVSSLKKFVRDDATLARFLEAHIAHIQEGDYFAVLAYLEMNEENENLLQQIRHKVLHKELCATCLGFGPRYLHSTGQAYKGGPNTGVFLQITSDDQDDLPVPNQKYSFGVVKAAQAIGDFQVLTQRKRRSLRVHIAKDISEGLKTILTALETI